MGRFHRHDGTEDHDHQYPHDHSHTHEHEHDHSHVDPALIGDHSGYGTSRQRVEILEDIFAENDPAEEGPSYSMRDVSAFCRGWEEA